MLTTEEFRAIYRSDLNRFTQRAKIWRKAMRAENSDSASRFYARIHYEDAMQLAKNKAALLRAMAE